MSLPEPAWKAAWISAPFCGGARTPSPSPYFRKAFRLEAPPKYACLHITALGLYEAEINGALIGDHVLAPGWTDYQVRVAYQSYDVTSQLRQGENALGVVLGDGWYCGHIAWYDRQQYGERPLLLCQLEITLENGSTVIIPSGADWKVAAGPILENDLLMGESYDARREIRGWSGPAFDGAAWLPALLREAPKGRIALVRSEAPPVRRQETLAAKSLPVDAPWNAHVVLYDLGQNMTGRARISVRGPAGLTVVMRHGEVLDPRGNLYTENLRKARCMDTYTLKGDGLEIYEPRFTFHGFRYIELRWRKGAGDLAVENVEGIVLHSDMPRTGTFSCSHPLINQLASNILWGQKGNFLEVPTDCPQRDERLGWTGDAQVFIRTAAFWMDVRGFFRKWLQDMRDAQGPEGQIPCVVPRHSSWDLGIDGGPAWADAATICPWTLFQCYGDEEVLRDHYECMVRYMRFLERNTVHGLIRCHPDRVKDGGYGDWLALDTNATTKDLIGTAFYANNADILSQTAERIGKADDAAQWRELHAKIAGAFQARFVTPGGLIVNGSQTSYVLALHFGLVPESSRAASARELARLIENNGYKLGTGFVGTPYLLHVLEAHGYIDLAYRLLEQEEMPSWLFPVKHGATTIWERWDGWSPAKGFQDAGMNSFNHYAYGAVGHWLVTTVAGLEIGAPGYEKILFKPRPGGSITHAEAKLLTRLGEVAIRWKIYEDALDLTLTVPPKAVAELSLPAGWSAPVARLEPGTHAVLARKSSLP
jgi:alpha-L-rhamnosidase